MPIVPGRNAQQAVVEVEELLFRGRPDVVDADLADYFGSIPHAELLKSVARRIVDPTIADAVLDRLVHTAHRLALDGETLRKPPEKSGK